VVTVAVPGLHVDIGGGASTPLAGGLHGLELGGLGTLRVEVALAGDLALYGKVHIPPSNYHPIDNVPPKLSIVTMSPPNYQTNDNVPPKDENTLNKIKNNNFFKKKLKLKIFFFKKKKKTLQFIRARKRLKLKIKNKKQKPKQN
jgi:hypothetical protein